MSETTQEPVKRGPGRPPKLNPPDQVSVQRISVIDRRLQGDPFGDASLSIPASTRRAGCLFRVFTADPEHADRHYKAVHRLGWTPATPDDLAVPPSNIGFTVNESGHVTRGVRGQDLLCWMRERDFLTIQARKAEQNSRRIAPAQVRADVAQATAKELGDQAGEQTYKNFEQSERHEPLGADE